MALPTYDYRPVNRSTEDVKIRTCSSRRARLTNQTYFRAREPGLAGNNISVQLIEYSPANAGVGGEAVVVVTNHNLSYKENVTGPATVKLLDLQADFTDLWQIEGLPSSPRTKKYSISLRIDFALDPASAVDLGPFTFDKMWSGDKLSVQLTQDGTQAASTSVISIAPRYRFYRLTQGSKTTTDTTTGVSTTTYGWDIANLRDQINASDPWIEMIPRTPVPETPVGGGPAPQRPPLNDAQDEGSDADWAVPFAEVFLSGGDGLPDNPTSERTGPSRSLVHVNYGELQNGELGEANLMYEWVGDNSRVGSWKLYQ